MKRRFLRILAIDPGTREMGVAVLDGDRLRYHAVQSFRGARSPHRRLREAREAVLGLVEDLSPDVLAVEAAFFAKSRNTALLNVLVDEIRHIAKERRLRLVSLAPSTVKKAVCGDGQANKAEVARAVAGRFPALKAYLAPDRKWKARYHANMFDAVAIGLTASRRVREAT